MILGLSLGGRILFGNPKVFNELVLSFLKEFAGT